MFFFSFCLIDGGFESEEGGFSTFYGAIDAVELFEEFDMFVSVAEVVTDELFIDIDLFCKECSSFFELFDSDGFFGHFLGSLGDIVVL